MIWLQRNYRFFFMFILTSTILCIYVFVFSWINVIKEHGGVGKVLAHDYLSDFLIIYCFIAVWFVGGLTAFHSYLICTNQVTFLLKFTDTSSKPSMPCSACLIVSERHAYTFISLLCHEP